MYINYQERDRLDEKFIEQLQNKNLSEYRKPSNFMRMRAKFKVTKVTKHEGSESLSFSAVGADKYGTDGTNDDNDFARYTPFGELNMTVNNPNLLGQFNEGEKYYLDFTKAE